MAGKTGTVSWQHILPSLFGLGTLYLVTQFARNALGVISGELEKELQLHSSETALLAGAMFLAYGLAQIPAAALLTRLGPRLVLSVAAVLLSLGLYGFAVFQSFGLLLAARIVTGIAAAPILAGSFSVLQSFGDQRFTLLNGLQTGFGRAGVVAATTPFALLVAVAGWREAFLWAATIAAASGIGAIIVLFRLAPGKRGPPPASRAGLLELARSRSFLAAAGFLGVITAVGNTILGLWGGPWLADVYGMGLTERGAMLIAMALGWCLSAPLWGKFTGRRLVLGSALLTVTLLVIPALLHVPEPLLLPWLALLGAATGFYPAVLAELRRSQPKGSIIYLSTLLTAGIMLVVFVVQLASGFAVDQFPAVPGSHPEDAYRAVFGLLALLTGLTTLAYRAFTSSSSRELKPGSHAGNAG